MKRHRAALLMGLVFVMAGCGAVQSGSEFSSSAREKCREAGYSDDQIDTLFVLTEGDREAGFSRSEELGGGITGCQQGCSGDSDCFDDCVTCATAITDEVYDR